jgi:hypothetical protein
MDSIYTFVPHIFDLSLLIEYYELKIFLSLGIMLQVLLYMLIVSFCLMIISKINEILKIIKELTMFKEKNYITQEIDLS